MPNWPLTAGLLISGSFAAGYALLLALATYENRRFARSHSRSPTNGVLPWQRIALIAPCKGQDHSFQENLRHLFQQDHPNYSLIFVVESERDEAVPIIRKLCSEYHQTPSRLVVAGRAIESGQKNHNLLAAIDQLEDEFNVYAFVDSDVQPDSNWLRSLVFGLEKEGIGAVTGYRWMIPTRNSLVNLIVYAINSATIALMGSGRHMLIWGGSWAIRREVFEGVGLRSAWCGTLCEDLVASRALRATNLGTVFAPRCVVTTEFDLAASGAWEFLHRQFLLGRRYSGGLWLLSLISLGLFQIGLWGCLLAGIYMLARQETQGWWALGAFVSIYGVTCLRHWLRQDRARTHLPRRTAELRTAGLFDIFLGPLAGVAQLVVMLSSALISSTCWRGIRYFVGPGGRVLFLGRTVGKSIATDSVPEVVPLPQRRAA
jgi:ceramide glucosyltransferase